LSKLVVDASIALKWVVRESGVEDALVVLERNTISAPELLLAECANALWKKVARREISSAFADTAATLLQQVRIELVPMRALVRTATALSVTLGHPAYDCFYIALAETNDLQFATADERFITKLKKLHEARFAPRILSLSEAALLSERGLSR
jgi:predicted nucleic acid-binding protein